MNFETDDVWMATDSVSADISINGVTPTQDSVEWSQIPTFAPNAITDNHRQFFDTDEFYQFDTTVAKSIPQTYTINDDEYTFLKTPSALEKSVWSVDNAPFAIEHPPMGTVTQTDEVHGVFHDSYFSPVDDTVNSTLSVPATDDEALSYLQENDNVSIGFYNRITESDRDAIDGEQQDIIVNHVAGVETGRCSDEDGCQIRM